MSLLKSILLGLVQGVTEFLPISSSGHLVLGQELLDFDLPGITFEVAVHLGTLLSILAVYYQTFLGMVSITFSMLSPFNSGVDWNRFKNDEHGRLVILILVGSLPAAVLGLTLKTTFERLFGSLATVGGAWLVTGFLLLLVDVHRRRISAHMGPIQAFLVGLFQAAAIVPGISRSGSTIAGGVLLGLEKREAADFSFLLSFPAVMGAVLVDFRDVLTEGGWQVEPVILAAGAVSAMLAGYWAIQTLLRVVEEGQMKIFAYYCFALGTLVLAWHILPVF